MNTAALIAAATLSQAPITPTGVSASISLDLGSAYRVEALQVTPAPGPVGPFDVETSADGVAWAKVLEGASVVGAGGPETVDLPDGMARHVRLSAKGLGLGSLPGLTDLQVIGRVPPPPGKVVILKLDDLTNYPPRVLAFQRALALLQAKNAKASFALVGGGLADTGSRGTALCDALKTFNASGRVEVIHHGSDHGGYADGSYEFWGTSPAFQLEHIRQTLDLAKNRCGVAIRTFNAPFNLCDATCATALEQTPEIRSVVFSGPWAKTTKAHLPNATRLNAEDSPGAVNYDLFLASWAAAASKPVVVIQIHPGQATEAGWANLEKMLDFLVSQNAVFKTPAELVP